MLTDDLDRRDEDEATPPGRVGFGAPHFARLLQSRPVRRVSSRRLVLAVGAGLTLAWGVIVLGSRAAIALTRYVAELPEHRIAFDAIELIPPPPPYVRSGSAAILDAVRQEGRFDASLSVPDLDLESLRLALSRNPWIEAVGAVRSSYRHIAAQVAYRQPLALMVRPDPAGKRNWGVLIDGHGVELPGDSGLEWDEPALRPAPASGVANLIQVWGLGAGVPDRVGLPWKSAQPNIPTAKVDQALRLAEYLSARAGTTTPRGRPYPDFVRIHYTTKETRQGLRSGFFLLDRQRNWILWDSGPGSEALTEVKADEKWRMLGRFIDEHEPFIIGGGRDDHLTFASSGAWVWRSTAGSSPAVRSLH